MNRLPAALTSSARAAPWIAALLVAGVGILGAVGARAVEQQRWKEQQSAVAEEAAAALEATLGRVDSGLSTAQGLTGDNAITAAEFAEFGAELLDGSGLDAVAYAPRVGADERAAFEAALGVPVADLTAEGLSSAATRAAYAPVQDVYPRTAGTLAVRGFDLLADPLRGPALQQAVTSGQAAATAPLTLAGGGDGITITQPVFRSGVPRSTAAERDAALIGFVSTAYSADAINALLTALLPSGSRYAIVDQDAPLVASEDEPGTSAGDAEATVLGRSYDIRAQNSGGPAAALSVTILTVGLVAAVFVLLLVALSQRRARSLNTLNAELERQRSELEAVQQVTAELSRATTAAATARALQHYIAEKEPDVLGTAVLVRNTPDGGSLNFVDSVRLDQVEAISLRDLAGAIGSSVIADQPRYGLDGWHDRTDAESALFADAVDLAVLPLRGTGDTTAAIVILYGAPQPFDDVQRRRLSTLALLGGAALRRGLRYDVEHEAATTLQRSLMPSQFVSPPGLTLAARYRPASRSALVGGDWWDAFHVDDKCVALVIGDAIGHGIGAAAAMGQLSSAARLALTAGYSPSAALDLLDRYVEQVPGAEYGTAITALLDLSDGSFVWSRAGHIPPLLVPADTESAPQFLEDGGGMPIGVLDEPRPQAQVTLSPGDTVLMITDGLIERRNISLAQSMAELARFTVQRWDSAEGLAAALLEHVGGAPGDDDQALLVATFDGR